MCHVSHGIQRFAWPTPGTPQLFLLRESNELGRPLPIWSESMSLPSTVTRSMDLRLVVSGVDTVPVQGRVTYAPADPYAVHAVFQVESDERIEWVFARDLLADGLVAPAGEGDVGVWPSRSGGRRVVCLSLSSPSGQALLEAPLDDVAEFVGDVYRAVPPGAESELLDLDEALARLLDH